MTKKSIRLIVFFLFALFAISLTGCKKQKPKSNMTGFELSLSNTDSMEVTHLVNMFFQYAEQGNYTEAAGMLYQADAQKHYDEPQPLDNDEMAKVRSLLSSLPIRSHTIEYIKFSETYSNEVKCNALIQPAKDNRPEISTVFYFKPVNYLGKWKLCLIDSNNGDQPIINSAQKDSMEKEYASEMRHKTELDKNK